MLSSTTIYLKQRIVSCPVCQPRSNVYCNHFIKAFLDERIPDALRLKKAKTILIELSKGNNGLLPAHLL
jgi:hypothetical protein